MKRTDFRKAEGRAGRLVRRLASLFLLVMAALSQFSCAIDGWRLHQVEIDVLHAETVAYANGLTADEDFYLLSTDPEYHLWVNRYGDVYEAREETAGEYRYYRDGVLYSRLVGSEDTSAVACGIGDLGYLTDAEAIKSLLVVLFDEEDAADYVSVSKGLGSPTKNVLTYAVDAALLAEQGFIPAGSVLRVSAIFWYLSEMMAIEVSLESGTRMSVVSFYRDGNGEKIVFPDWAQGVPTT